MNSLLAGDTYTAEDVAQETALRLWQHPEVFDSDQPLGAWLRTVARNIVIDRVRRRQARPSEIAFSLEIDGDNDSADTDDAIDRANALAWVTTALTVLAPHHRSAVFEVYVRDHSIADAARDLGIPSGTVKSRCHHALRQLRAWMADHPEMLRTCA